MTGVGQLHALHSVVLTLAEEKRITRVARRRLDLDAVRRRPARPRGALEIALLDQQLRQGAVGVAVDDVGGLDTVPTGHTAVLVVHANSVADRALPASDIEAGEAKSV